MKITGMYSYPLKSSKAISMQNSAVLSTGLVDDRTLVVIGENNKVITGRELPKLTSITANITDGIVSFSREAGDEVTFTLPSHGQKKVTFKLFRKMVEGLLFDAAASNWLSTILGTSCRLVYINENFIPIDTKQGGKTGDFVGYADASPIHLISEASLEALNSLLDKKVTPLHFRPNLLMRGNAPYEEDNWKTVIINDCEFEVHNQCKRCIFTTINPLTAEKDENVEPLSTLAKFRKERNEELTFGIYLVPRKTGSIQVGNNVVVEI